MQQNHWLCNEHGLQINKICIEDHQCKDRRLCVDCILDDHKSVDNNKMPSTQEFLNLLNNKLKNFKEDDFKGFLKTIEILQSNINGEFEKLKKQTSSVVELIKKGDKPILQLKEQLAKRPLLEFSRGDYNYMKDILEGNILEHIIHWRQKLKTIYQKQLQGFYLKSQQFINQIQSTTSERTCVQLEKNVRLIGSISFGLKQGEYYYLFFDGTTKYAGNYELGIKQGIWNDYFGQNDYEQRRIFSLVKYLNGVNLGKEGGPYGQFDQQLNKTGEWLEVGGVWNQLIYKGQYQRGIKVGQWKVQHEDKIIGQGEYNNLEKKIGPWTEAIDGYDICCAITFSGEYKNGVRVGQWSTLHEGRNIGGGTYDENGEKNGQWTDLDQNYNWSDQVIFKGEYKNGIKFGQWKAISDGKNCGGGAYNKIGAKIGQWKELHDKYHYFNQVVFQGEYRNGLRYGKWLTADEQENQIIGGGNYDENGIKIGQWIDLHKNFAMNCRTTFLGEYRNGFKYGKWLTKFERNRIGGGNYNENGVKIGQWTDLHENFSYKCQVTFTGEYRNGIKFGEWSNKYEGNNIGGGLYNENGVKIGKWTDLFENFQHFCEVTFTGEYKDGIRCGKWSTACEGNIIGGGTYNDKGAKIGLWTDLHEQFMSNREVFFTGEYSNGIRIGQWFATYKGEKIGDGKYNEKGIKIGQWTELHTRFSNERSVTFTGEYSNGRHVGTWSFAFEGNIIGGGTYDKNGVRIGKWTDLYDHFKNDNQLTYTGEYKNGVKIGKWKKNQRET